MGGNAGFAADGATITAHSNVKNRLAAGTVNALTGVRTPPAIGAAAAPTGDPRSDPNQQGEEGAENAPSGPGVPGGPQAGNPAPDAAMNGAFS